MLLKSQGTENTFTVCVEKKNPCVNGPTQFKTLLFKGPLSLF